MRKQYDNNCKTTTIRLSISQYTIILIYCPSLSRMSNANSQIAWYICTITFPSGTNYSALSLGMVELVGRVGIGSMVGTNNHADTKICNLLIGRLLSYNSWKIILITTGISCTSCIHISSPKCILQQQVVPKSKQQQNSESHSSELRSIPGFTGEVEGLGQREAAEHKDYCVCATNCASAPS